MNKYKVYKLFRNEIEIERISGEVSLSGVKHFYVHENEQLRKYR